MRLMLGNVRPDTPRGALKIKAHAMAERLAGRVIDAALDEEADPLKAGSLALRVIDSVDPPDRASLEISGELSADGLKELSLSELLAVAAQHGIDYATPPATPPALEA